MCVTGASPIARGYLSGATPWGQPWTPTVPLPHRCDGLSAQRMAVLWTFCAPSLCRHVCGELLRNALCDFTLILPTTACHQRNYVETYSRFIRETYQRLARYETFAQRGLPSPKTLGDQLKARRQELR